ncbi:MAG: SHOCT domain-containing protein [Caldilineaceae bacterium]
MLNQATTLLDGRMAGGAPGAMMHGGGHGMFLFGGLGSVVSTVVIVLVVLWVVNNWSRIKGWFGNAMASVKQGISTPATSAQSPLDVVQMRYAKGEISKEEYETMRGVLSGEGTPIPVTEAPANS